MTESWTLHDEHVARPCWLESEVERLKAENSALMGDWEKAKAALETVLSPYRGQAFNGVVDMPDFMRKSLQAICDLLEAETVDPECLEHGEHPLSSDDPARYCSCKPLGGLKAEKASEIVRDACGSRPDLMSGKDYVDEVRGHLTPSLEDRVRGALETYAHRYDSHFSDARSIESPFDNVIHDIVALVDPNEVGRE